MGENLYDDVDGETPDAKQRRLNLLKAVEGDGGKRFSRDPILTDFKPLYSMNAILPPQRTRSL